MAKPRRSHEEIEAEQEMELLRQEAMEAEERSRPLQSLPAQTAKLLLEILSESQVFQQNLEDQQLDLCHEVSRDEVQEALFLLKTSSTEREATAILDCFPGDAPHLTIFELCARVGRGDLLRSLQSAAQGKLRDLIFGGRASLQQVFRLLRAGAELSRQNLSSFVNLKGDAKRTKIELGPRKGMGVASSWASGTPLHWVCWAASRVPSAQRSHYLEIARWLCDAAPLALLLKNDEHLTPLELLLVANLPQGDELRCSKCGFRGHVAKDCIREESMAPSKDLVAALAVGFSKAMQQYPLLTAARVSAGGLVRAAASAKELLLEGDAAVDGFALEALEALLSQETETEALPNSAQLCAAETLGGLAAARARQKAMSSIKSTADAEMEKADNVSLRRQLASANETHQRERQELEQSLEALEAQLVEAQRRAEAAEVQAACLAQSQAPATEEKAAAGGSTPPPWKAATQGGSSEASFVAALRRRRLVAEGQLPDEVREGVKQLSESLCAAVERLANDLYESECHFLYEIIQNAEDAHAHARPKEAREPRLSLRLGPPSPAFPHGFFLSENNEAGFTERDVTALCDISASSKKKPMPGAEGGSIGCKGIGFKSVFTVSDRAHVLSKGFTFVFDVAGPLGKLGYVTPTWLGEAELAKLPPEVREAHHSGRTVLFLPLRASGLAAAIGQEMDELAGPGRASLLFLRRLCSIELLRGNQPLRLLRRRAEGVLARPQAVQSAAVVLEEEGEPPQEHEYLVYNHRTPVGPGASADLVLAFPASSEESRCEPLFCTLPIRQVGYGFALHSAVFDLVANRSDLHRGSLANRAVRDALPEAFAGACAAAPEISRRALALLGEPVADPFWRVAREGVLERLSDVSCVQTSAGQLRKPGEVLLRGSGPLRRASELLPGELVNLSCGRSLCDAGDAGEERLLRRLGAETFSARHFAQCLAYQGGAWPRGWVAATWAEDVPSGRRIAALYNLLGFIMRPGGESSEAQTSELLLQLPSLPLFPLLSKGQSERPCAKLEEGPIFLGICSALTETWQLALGESGALRLLPPAVSSGLDSLGAQLLASLGVEAPSRAQLAEAALQRLLRLQPGAEAAPLAFSCWAALAVLRDLWAEPETEKEIRGLAAVRQALVSLGSCGSLEEAKKLMAGQGLGALLLAPAEKLQPPPTLRCPSVLGHLRQLPSDLVERIEAFLGLSAARPSPNLQTWPLAEGQDGQQRKLEALRWEAFFVDCLGAQPRRPADWRQERASPDLVFSLGQELGSDGPRSLWVSLLDEKAVPDAVFRYAVGRLEHSADRAWLAELPARATLKLRELFLHSVYWPVAGAALNGLYLDLPQLGAAGRGAELQKRLAALGARARLDVEGLSAALQALLRGQCRSASHFARLYLNIDTLETTGAAGAAHGEDVEAALRECIFDPAVKEPMRADDCVWELPKNEVLTKCCHLTVLSDIYASFGDVQMKRYFERRGVPGQPHTAECYLRMRSNLMNAAEEFGKAWRRAEGNPEMAMVPLPSMAQPGGKISATDFLDQIWDALIFIYKGMSTLEGQERQALRPFSPVEAILVPLPGAGSMLEVARFHDGALFRRISVCESFWEVAPDLADSVAALWALSGFFPPELRPLFVECFGVREVVDAAALREGIQARINHGKRGGQSRGSGGFGFVAGDGRGRMVNELGLPEELLRALGGDTVTEADALAAAEEALASLRRRGRGGHSGSSDDEGLLTPALPARSVRCPPVPERRLSRCGSARRVCVFQASSPAGPGALGRRYEAPERELDELAAVLLNLVAVFRLDADVVAIVNGDELEDDGECHHGARRSWPLLFSAGLRPPAETGFWFGEFCHALAHRSTGPGHGARHSRVMQILMAQHFDDYARSVRQAPLREPVPARRRRRSSSSRRSRRSRRRR